MGTGLRSLAVPEYDPDSAFEPDARPTPLQIWIAKQAAQTRAQEAGDAMSESEDGVVPALACFPRTRGPPQPRLRRSQHGELARAHRAPLCLTGEDRIYCISAPCARGPTAPWIAQHLVAGSVILSRPPTTGQRAAQTPPPVSCVVRGTTSSSAQ